MIPGGKVRAISREALARGDIARRVKSLGIACFGVIDVNDGMGTRRRDYARSRVHIINTPVSRLGSKTPRLVLNTKHP